MLASRGWIDCIAIEEDHDITCEQIRLVLVAAASKR